MAHVRRGMVLWVSLALMFVLAAIAASVPRAIDALLPLAPGGATDAAPAAPPAAGALHLLDDPAIAATLAGSDAAGMPALRDLSLDTYENVAAFCNQAKISCGQATLRLIEGRRGEALSLIVAVCAAVQSAIVERPDHGVIHAAITVKSLAVKTLELYILNAVETPAECERAAAILAALAAADLPLAESIYQPRHAAPRAASEGPPQREDQLLVPYDAARARLQMLRLAVAARHYKALHGAFPGGPEALAALIPGPAPVDPASGGAIRARAEAGDFLIWTPGPDGSDDNGALAFDPRRGWISGGDIIVRVEAARRFPFPAQPPQRLGDDGSDEAAQLSSVAAVPPPSPHISIASPGPLSRLYPNGLPMDVFSELQAMPLLWAPRDDGRGVIVFSRGPEKIRNHCYDNATPAYPRAPYDPTNGVMSGGHLTATIPLPAGAPRDRVTSPIAQR